MKKYTKPMIVFESFTLSTNIAGDCVAKADGQTSFYVSGCGIMWPTTDLAGNIIVEQLFAQGYVGCGSFPAVDDRDNNTYCYDIPTGANPIFNS